MGPEEETCLSFGCDFCRLLAASGPALQRSSTLLDHLVHQALQPAPPSLCSNQKRNSRVCSSVSHDCALLQGHCMKTYRPVHGQRYMLGISPIASTVTMARVANLQQPDSQGTIALNLRLSPSQTAVLVHPLQHPQFWRQALAVPAQSCPGASLSKYHHKAMIVEG